MSRSASIDLICVVRFTSFTLSRSLIVLFSFLLFSNHLSGQEQKSTFREFSSEYSNSKIVRIPSTKQKSISEISHLAGSISEQPDPTAGVATSSSGIICPSGNCNPSPKAAYLTSSTFGNPWFTEDNYVAMDLAFGTGNWDSLYFESVDISVLLSGQYDVIFLEGSDFGAVILSDFLTAHLPAIEAWVFSGGALFLNAAPNVGGDIDFGFGGFILEYSGSLTFDFSDDGIVLVPSHPVFNGPATPASGNFTGNFFSHGIVKPVGTSWTELIINTLLTGASLVELSFGNGTVMFGAMTVPSYHTPIPNAANFRANILSYLAGKANCIQFEFETDAGFCTYTVANDTLDARFNGNDPGNVLFHNFPNAPQSFTLQGAQLQMGLTTVVWTAIDAAGNSSTCSVVVNVINIQTEVCNGLDDDCDGLVDESGGQTWYADIDGDGFGAPGVDSVSCNQPLGFVPNNTDCNDLEALVNPVATEICNGVDDNCNGLTDDADPGTVNQPIWYADTDGDGFGNALVDSASCLQPPGFVQDNTDCDDTNAAINPAADEPCNGLDDNCNGLIDEAVIGLIVKETDLSCNNSSDGSITTALIGGAPPFIYQWSNGEITADLFGLPAGAYSLTVTDNNLCSTMTSVTIEAPLPLSTSVAAYPVSCFGKADGYIASTVTGGIGPYLYYWSNKSETADIDSLTVGIFDLTVTDANGCTVTTSVGITEPPPLTVMTTEVGITCFGAGNGTSTAVAAGGNAPYNYLWSNGNSGASNLNLFPGTYLITITDSKGCTVLASSTIIEPAELTAILAPSDATCFGDTDGVLTTTSSGGTPPYFYQWSNGSTDVMLADLSPGVYSLTLTDNNGCSSIYSGNISQPAPLSIVADVEDISCNGNEDGTISTTVNGGILPYQYIWSNGTTTKDINGLIPQTYSLTITDGNGCTITSTAVINEPLPLSALASVNNVLCNGGSDGVITVLCSGGISPYSYFWNNGVTSSTASALSAGSYQLTITDENGCLLTLVSNVSEPQALTVSTVDVSVTCNGLANGSLAANINGGTIPYDYQWSNGNTGQTASGLPAGAYNLTVTDANGCRITTSDNITEPAALSLIVDETNVTCNGLANGSVATLVYGGTEPYSYLWSNGGANPLLNNLSADQYGLTVTDNNGCTSTLTATVIQPPVLVPDVTAIAVACHGDASGEAASNVTGGIPPYVFQWSNGANTSTLGELTAGVYSLTVTDQNQCQAIEVANIMEPPLLSAVTDLVNVTCNGYTDGSVEVLVSGGTSPYDYRWSTGDNLPDLVQLAVGAYSVTVTDSNGCTIVESVDVIVDHPLTIDLGADRDLNLGDRLEVQVNTNIGPNEVDQYTWITRADTLRCQACPTYSDLPLKSGCLTVLVESVYGCTESATVCFQVEALRRVYVPNVFKPDSGDDNARVTLFTDASVKGIRKLMFFDRWGTLLHIAENILPNSESAGWDGTYSGSMMAAGVYVWVAELEFIDGKTEVFQGDVTLLR